jgi:hypothetical protein
MAAYCDRAFLEKRFGAANIRTWADMDNDHDAAKIEAAVADALETASRDLDDMLRGGPYTVPFTTVPDMIKDLTRKEAACQLYAARGCQDVDGEGNPVDKLAGVRAEIDRKIRMIRGRKVTFDLDSTAHVPVVVPGTLHRDSDLVY